jgi:hypothetical protein
MVPGIKDLLAGKNYDTDAFRAFLRKKKIKPVIPAHPTARSASATQGLQEAPRHRALFRTAPGFPAHRHPL